VRRVWGIVLVGCTCLLASCYVSAGSDEVPESSDAGTETHAKRRRSASRDVDRETDPRDTGCKERGTPYATDAATCDSAYSLVKAYRDELFDFQATRDSVCSPHADLIAPRDFFALPNACGGTTITHDDGVSRPLYFHYDCSGQLIGLEMYFSDSTYCDSNTVTAGWNCAPLGPATQLCDLQ
jgi:hypothetical protein